ncbi:MAG: bifunctional DNA-formamidopyrimidine glycosylase/DNA-(apurinic or apyrimidinic site) lyase [Actinomycetes bacterium]
MPELPEVETTRRHLEPVLVGRVIERAEVTHPRTARRNASTREVEERLAGRRVLALRRHGKFLVGDLDDGWTLIAHLGMSGRFSYGAADDEVPPHTHVMLHLDDGTVVRFTDPRTFGFVAVYDEDEMASSTLGRLGPDAWSDGLDAAALQAKLAGRKAPIKALLLDQGPVAGLGNIYADEVLHRAGVHPLTPGGDIPLERLEAMVGAMREVLATAIDAGGTTLDDLAYLLPDGRAGENLRSLRVYGRTGEPCVTCGTPIERIVVRARSTHYCPKCQHWA